MRRAESSRLQQQQHEQQIFHSHLRGGINYDGQQNYSHVIPVHTAASASYQANSTNQRSYRSSSHLTTPQLQTPMQTQQTQQTNTTMIGLSTASQNPSYRLSRESSGRKFKSDAAEQQMSNTVNQSQHTMQPQHTQLQPQPQQQHYDSRHNRHHRREASYEDHRSISRHSTPSQERSQKSRRTNTVITDQMLEQQRYKMQLQRQLEHNYSSLPSYSKPHDSTGNQQQSSNLKESFAYSRRAPSEQSRHQTQSQNQRKQDPMNQTDNIEFDRKKDSSKYRQSSMYSQTAFISHQPSNSMQNSSCLNLSGLGRTSYGYEKCSLLEHQTAASRFSKTHCPSSVNLDTSVDYVLQSDQQKENRHPQGHRVSDQQPTSSYIGQEAQRLVAPLQQQQQHQQSRNNSVVDYCQKQLSSKDSNMFSFNRNSLQLVPSHGKLPVHQGNNCTPQSPNFPVLKSPSIIADLKSSLEQQAQQHAEKTSSTAFQSDPMERDLTKPYEAGVRSESLFRLPKALEGGKFEKLLNVFDAAALDLKTYSFARIDCQEQITELQRSLAMIANYVELARQEIAKEAANLVELKDLSNLQLIHANERKAHYKAKYGKSNRSQNHYASAQQPAMTAQSTSNRSQIATSTNTQRTRKSSKKSSCGKLQQQRQPSVSANTQQQNSTTSTNQHEQEHPIKKGTSESRQRLIEEVKDLTQKNEEVLQKFRQLQDQNSLQRKQQSKLTSNDQHQSASEGQQQEGTSRNASRRVMQQQQPQGSSRQGSCQGSLLSAEQRRTTFNDCQSTTNNGSSRAVLQQNRPQVVLNPLPIEQMIITNLSQEKQERIVADKLSKKDSIHQLSDSDRNCKQQKYDKFKKPQQQAKQQQNTHKLSSTIMNIGKSNKNNCEVGSSIQQIQMVGSDNQYSVTSPDQVTSFNRGELLPEHYSHLISHSQEMEGGYSQTDDYNENQCTAQSNGEEDQSQHQQQILVLASAQQQIDENEDASPRGHHELTQTWNNDEEGQNYNFNASSATAKHLSCRVPKQRHSDSDYSTQVGDQSNISNFTRINNLLLRSAAGQGYNSGRGGPWQNQQNSNHKSSKKTDSAGQKNGAITTQSTNKNAMQNTQASGRSNSKLLQQPQYQKRPTTATRKSSKTSSIMIKQLAQHAMRNDQLINLIDGGQSSSSASHIVTERSSAVKKSHRMLQHGSQQQQPQHQRPKSGMSMGMSRRQQLVPQPLMR